MELSRREFLKFGGAGMGAFVLVKGLGSTSSQAVASGAIALTTGLAFNKAMGFVPAHNWEKYDFGSGPEVKDRLCQGPFPQYEPEPVVAGSEVVMSTMPSDRILKNYGMGMTTYVCDEHGHPNRSGKDLENHLRDLVSLDLGQKLYLRCD